MAKLKVCIHCGKEIPKSARVCPYCKGKNKVPFFSRIWVWILLVLLVSFAWRWFMNIEPSTDHEYTAVTVDQLYEELSDNPLKAKDTYTDAYVAVEGKMRVIDSDGESISIYPLEYDSLDGIRCTLSSDEQREKVKEHSKGDVITVKGKITEVDGIFPYKIYVDSIE